MYLKLLSINTFKKVSLERVMSFENSSVPLSFFTDDGMMSTTKKSDFMGKLEDLVSNDQILHKISSVQSILFDGMAVIQMLLPTQSPLKLTYFDMASSFWKHIVDKSDGSPCIHVVFDNYFIEGSIKSQTRERRGEQLTPSNAPSHLQPNVTVTDWKQEPVGTG